MLKFSHFDHNDTLQKFKVAKINLKIETINNLERNTFCQKPFLHVFNYWIFAKP